MKFLPLIFLRKGLLRPDHKWLSMAVAIATVAIGLGLAAFLALGLAHVLDIPNGVPVKDQPNGKLWMRLSAVALLLSFGVGYLSSFALLAAVLRWRQGWTVERIRELIFESRIPAHWLRHPDA